MNTLRTRTKNPRFYPWLVWGLGAVFLFYKYLLETSPGVMSMSLMRDFAITGTQLGNLAASYFYAYLIMQIPMGVFTDRFGPRRVTTIAIIICALGTLLFSYSHLFWVAMLARFITGVGAAVAALSCLKLTTLWFPAKRFPTMAGIMMCLGMLGAVGAEAPLSLAMKYFGWRHAMIYGAIIGLVLALIYWLLVRDHGPHAPKPESLAKEKNKIFKNLAEIFKSKQTWLLSVYSGLAFSPVSVFGGLWGVPFLEKAHHLTRTLAAEEVSLIFIGFAVGAPLWGWLSAHLGRRRNIMLWGTIAAFICVCSVLYLPDVGLFSGNVLLFLFGFFISSFLLCFTMVRQVNRLILAATAIGFMNSFDAFLGAITDPIIGKILDLGWLGKVSHGDRIFPLHDYHVGMLVIPLYLIVALVLIVFIKETYDVQKW